MVEKTQIKFERPTPRSCNLECVKGNKEIGEFVGPVKIVLVHTPKLEHCLKIWCAGSIGLAYIMLGANVSLLFYFTLSMKLPFELNLHILLCTLGFQLLIPMGILMFNTVNGPSLPMSIGEKKLNHILVQICGITCGIVGGFAVKIYKISLTEITFHSGAGIAACLLSLFGAAIGPFLVYYKVDSIGKIISHSTHKTVGAACFLSSSLCFISGIMRPSIVNWLPVPAMEYFIISFCIFYTAVIFTVSFIKSLSSQRDVI